MDKKEELECQSKILSGIIKYYNDTINYKKISNYLNLKNFDVSFHKIIKDLIKHDFIDVKDYTFFNYDEKITIEEVTYNYIKIKDKKEERKVLSLKEKVQKIENIDDMSSLIISEINGNGNEINSTLEDLSISNVLENNIDFLNSFKGKGVLGRPFGIEALDERTEGVFGLVGLTATPGAGKTTLALQSAYHNAFILNVPCLYITLEVPKKMFVAKFISFITGIPLKKMLKEYLSTEEAEKVNEAQNSILNNKNLFIMDNSDGVNFLNILKYIKNIQKKYLKEENREVNPLVILDYLNLFHDSGTIEKLDKNDKVSHQMIKFIEMKNETLANFLLIAAKNKRGYDVADLASIKGPNDLEYAFETILSLEKTKNIDDNLTEYVNVFGSILKSRWGEAFINIPMHFSGKRSRFFDIDKIPEEVKNEFKRKNFKNLVEKDLKVKNQRRY